MIAQTKSVHVLEEKYKPIFEQKVQEVLAAQPATAPSRPKTRPAPTTVPSPGTPVKPQTPMKPHPLTPTTPGISPNPKALKEEEGNPDLKRFVAKRTQFKR